MSDDYDYLMGVRHLTGLPDVTHLFKGARGSLYAHHGEEGNTTAFREPSNMKGTGKKVQKPSTRTLYIPSDEVDDLARPFKNKDIATELMPSSDGKQLQIRALAPGEMPFTRQPFKTNDILASVPVSRIPYVGAAPIELFGSHISPIGSDGRGVHWGSEIKEVHPTAKKISGKLGIAGALFGGTGAANAGEYRKAAGDVAESFMPLGLTPSPLGNATRPAGEREAEDQAYAAKKAAEQERALKAQALLRSGVPMPDGFAVGGRVRLI